MPLTRLDNLISSKTGKYLYVSPDDFNASDALDNRGTSPTRPFLTIQRAFLEVSRFSYVPGSDNDRFDQFTILLAPGTHYIDNRPGDATAASVPVFNYSAGEWNDNTSFDLSDPNNVLRRFNSVEGGCIIPRGTSLVGTDLRRTQLRPLYVPDPADKDVGRTSLFQVTGGCYFWQFTIQDGDLTINSPLWDSVQNIGKVYSQPDSTVLSIPEYSHHKITNFVFARKEDLGALYAKVAKAFSAYQPTIDDPGEFDYRIQENRIVGPLSDSVTIESIKVDNITTGPASGTADITVNTKINHGYFVGQYVAVTGMNAGQGKLNGVWKVKSINSTNLKQFVFNVPYNAAGLGLVPSGATWTESTTPKLSSVGTTASVQAEVDSVESASPYVFNVSIRSTWGICGIWADGSRATGFKSMVIAQYTGVSLQKDDRAFIKYDEFTNTWNQANLQDAFSSTPYHIDGTAYWKDDWRNFHVRASEDAFIQNVSIFAVGFADHFLMESGGDMSITNSNSNFGNTSLHTIGYKNFAFNQDKGGYISHIVPPKKLLDTEIDIKNYYTLNVTLSNDSTNSNRLYYGIDESSDPTDRPAGSIDGFKIGAKSGEKLYVKLDAVAGESGKQIKSAIVSPNGVKKWRANLTALSPSGQVVGDLDGDGDSNDAQDVRQYNLRLDAANLIDSNKAFIQSEAFGYILEKYPSLQTTPYVNPGVTGDTNRYRDASNLIRSNRQAIIDSAYDQIAIDHPTFVNPDPTKCRRDIGYIVDALISDLYNGANSASIDAARSYFNATTVVNTTPSTDNATASVTSTQLSAGTLPVSLFPAAGSSGQNPDVSWSFTLPTAVTNAGIAVSSYDLLLEDLHAVDTNGFPLIHWRVDNIPSTVTSIPSNAAQLNIPGATFRPNYVGSPNTTGVSPVGYTGPEPGTENHTYRLTVRANLNNSTSTVVSSLQFNYDNTYAAPTTSGSYSLPRTTLRPNNLVINYNVVTTINAGTPISNGLLGEEAQSVTAFNKVAVEAKKAMRNQLGVTDLTIIADPVTGSNTSNASCANVATTIDNLISIVTTAVTNGNLNSLPPRNGGSWLGTSKCKRDIGYIVEAVTSDLRLGGNENVINAAEAYYVGTNLDYINNELNETLDAYNYVRDLTIAAMRNWSFQIQNASTTNGSSVITVASTVGIVLGMRVSGTGIPSNSYVKRIINGTTFELGNSDSRLTTGNTVNATVTSTTTLTLTLDAGIWAEVDNLAPITDSSVIPDTNYPECSGVATAISTYFTAISTVLNSGLGTVSRSPSTVSGASISTRATLFTLTEVGTSSPTNPHDLETGTAVRLVPRAINETVDKRVVRLPKGFDSNTKYYVIAPGRSTEPFNFSNYTSPSGNVPFDGSAATQQAIMLATSIENANAGIYIYSPETESIDSNVVIEVHQYVQDVKYDLVQYRCSIVPGSNSVFETEGPHGFDKQQTNTTPQKVFFRGGAQTPDISGSVLPTRTIGGTLPDNVEYYVRYVPPAPGQQRNTRFTIHTSHSDAISGTNEVTFSNSGTSFYVFSNKRRSPIKFAPEVNLQDTTGNKGCWYINTSSTNNGILDRLKLPVYDDTRGKTRTTDTWFERVRDERTVSDTVYRLRYVIPKDGNYREPINGFVFKLRTDETRRLLPQKIVLKPVGPASSFANVTKNGERLGLTTTEQINGSAYNTANPNFVSSYDPYIDPFSIETDNKINFSVQSAKKVNVSGNDYLQLTVFDVSVVDAALKTSILTTVKVDTPQGGTGNFVVGNSITWSGNSTGSGVVHAWFPTHNYLIIKNAVGELNYSSSNDITFTQGSVTARMLEDKDGGRSDRSKYLYAVEGANVYTMTPGDTVTLPVPTGGTAQYRIDSVQDVSDLENTYYVFKSETIRKRIKGQQDGIYYITAIRGDIKPFPTGSGVGENFRNFKFSQPVSRIYPLATKNDPLWFQVTDSVVNQENPNRDTTIIDPPETVSTADNYVHGYVSVNDAKRSVTKEAILDLTKDPGIGLRTYTNENRIQAKEGAASAGSEARRIPIAGDSDFPTEQRIYVELRRPSIARSGNHTFEYLGFGPGNYSTGFPARQQVILTDVQDFYAQAKREDAGLVLYTGLNSSGDLYIGNRKINAITGEETLLDAPITEEEDEEVGIAGALVTTFDDPVTFNNTVTFNYNQVIPATLSVVTVGVPVLINSEAVNTSGAVVKPPLSIQNYTAEATQEEYDPLRNGLSETMTFGNNIAYFGVWKITPRGSQGYSIRTHKNNITPNTQPSSGAPYNNFYSTTQLLNITNGNWGNIPAKAGTILYKGSQVNYSGSLGWIYANDYTALTTTGVTPQVTNIQTFVGYTVVKVSFSDTLGNLGIKPDTQFRTTNSSNAILNSGADGVPFSIPGSVLIDAATAGGSQISEAGYPGASSNYVWINIAPNAAVSSVTQLASNLGPINISISNSFWKEVGVIGAEAIRTETQSLGNYKLGVNTLARATDTAYQNAFVQTQTSPVANLDVEGNAFISGKATASSIDAGGTNTKAITNVDNALLVGGAYLTPSNTATLRVATTDNGSATTTYQTGGRVGINVPFADLDRNLTVRGNARITGDFKFENNIEVNGTTTATSATLSTTNSTFNLINTNATTLNFAGALTVGNLFNTATTTQDLNIGTAVTGITSLDIHTSTTDSTINIGTVGDTVNTYKSLITIGGAYARPSDSIFRVKNFQTILNGNLQIEGDTLNNTATINSSRSTINLFTQSGSGTTLRFGTFSTDTVISAVAGTTTIQNNLIVKAGGQVFSSFKMNGGYLSAAAGVTRGVLGTPASVHALGTTTTLNIDYYRFVDNIDGSIVINSVASNTFTVPTNTQYFDDNQIIRFVDVTGLTGINTTTDYYVINPTASTFQVSLVNSGPPVAIGGAVTSVSATLKEHTVYNTGYVDWPATDTNLPLNNPKGIGPNEYLLIDNEIVKTTNFPSATSPYLVPVLRGQEGTTAAIHSSGAVIYKLEKTPGASYITPNPLPSSDITKTGTGVISMNTSTNFLTTTGTNLVENYIVKFTDLGGITSAVVPATPVAINTSYYIVNLTTTGASQSFQLSTTPYPSINALDLEGSITAATSFTVDADIVNLAEFGGSFGINDYLRLDGTYPSGSGAIEFVRITSTPQGATKKFSITDGAAAPTTTFEVDSITGNTTILGNLNLQSGFTLSGSTVCGTQLFKINDGAIVPVDVFTVDSCNGDTIIGKSGASGGSLTIGNDLQIKSNIGGTTFFSVDAQTGNTVIGNGNDGTLRIEGNATSTSTTTGALVVDGGVGIAENLNVGGDATVAGGDLTVTSGGTTRFKVNNSGRIDLGGIENYISTTGGRKWQYVTANTTLTSPNVNVVVFGGAADIIITLPSNPQTGDTIRFLDISGVWTYNRSLVIRCPLAATNLAVTVGTTQYTGVAKDMRQRLQGDFTGTRLGGLPAAYDAGELVIQTRNAGFGLVYIGPQDSFSTLVNANFAGWWLMEI